MEVSNEIMANQFLKRMAMWVLGMVIMSAIFMVGYTYVLPYVLSGEAATFLEDGSGAVLDGLDGIGEAVVNAGSHMEKIGSDNGIGLPSGNEPVTGTVHRIVDGDTLVVGSSKIRLALVNTPERGEPGYGEAVRFTAVQCPVGSQATYLEDSGQPGGSYGRVIAKVWCGSSESLNELLLRNGHAEILRGFCDKSEFGVERWATACHASTP